MEIKDIRIKKFFLQNAPQKNSSGRFFIGLAAKIKETLFLFLE